MENTELKEKKIFNPDKMYKNIGEYEITSLVDKAGIIKQLKLNATFNNAMEFEIYKHLNNVYILNKSTLSHFNLQSKQLKDTLTSHNSMDLYKAIGTLLFKDIQRELKNNKKIKKSTTEHNRTMSKFQIGDIYYYEFGGYGLPAIKGYRIVGVNKSSIKVELCHFSKKVTNKTIKYELLERTNTETMLIRIYKNQDFLLNGYEVKKLPTDKKSITVRF